MRSLLGPRRMAAYTLMSQANNSNLERRNKMDEQRKKEIAAEMDAALEKARVEIPSLKDAQDVAKWIAKWYLTAGYKRLNRALMQYYGL